MNYGEATKATNGWGMVVSPNSGGAKGGGARVVIGKHHTQADYGGAVHFHLALHGDLPRSGEAPGDQGCETVVRSGRPAARGRLGDSSMKTDNRRSGQSLRGQATRGWGRGRE